MKYYYFLDQIETTAYHFLEKKIVLIKTVKDVDDAISEYHRLFGDILGDTNKLVFLDCIMFIKYYLNNISDNLDDLELMYLRNMLIINERLFIEKDGEFVEQKQDSCFISYRDSFFNPFFMMLKKLPEIFKVKIARPNYRTDRTYDDRMFVISQLYKQRSKTLGDIAIPFLMSRSSQSLELMFKKVAEVLGNKIVVKLNHSERGKYIKALDISDINQEFLDFFQKEYIKGLTYSTRVMSLFPWYEMQRELRVYYAYNCLSDKVAIYSVKRKNNEYEGSIFDKPSIELDESISASRHLIDLEVMLINKRFVEYITRIGKLVGLDRGVVEIAEIKEGIYKFIEVNTMGASLMFEGKDEKSMMNYYYDLRKIVGKKKNL